MSTECFYQIYIAPNKIYFRTRNDIYRFIEKFYDHTLPFNNDSNKKEIQIFKYEIINKQICDIFDNMIYGIVCANESNTSPYYKFCNLFDYNNKLQKVFRIYNRKTKKFINRKSKDLKDTFKAGHFWTNIHAVWRILEIHHKQLDKFIDVYEYETKEIYEPELSRWINIVNTHSKEMKPIRTKRFTSNYEKIDTVFYRIKNNKGEYSSGQHFHSPPMMSKMYYIKLFNKYELDEHLRYVSKAYPNIYKNCVIETYNLQLKNTNDVDINIQELEFKSVLTNE